MKKNGFTLLELLVTVAILAIAMSLITGILVNANKVNIKTQAEAKLDSSLNRTLEIIKRSIREASISKDPNVVEPVVSSGGSKLTVNVFTGSGGNTMPINFIHSSTSSTIYVDNPSDIIGQNIVYANFEVVDCRRYTPPTNNPDNLGEPLGGGVVFYGGNTLVKITLKARVAVPGQGNIERTVSDTIITRVGLGQ